MLVMGVVVATVFAGWRWWQGGNPPFARMHAVRDEIPLPAGFTRTTTWDTGSNCRINATCESDWSSALQASSSAAPVDACRELEVDLQQGRMAGFQELTPNAGSVCLFDGRIDGFDVRVRVGPAGSLSEDAQAMGSQSSLWLVVHGKAVD
jgi:hypothetical protein